jgi:hypothetical protein
MRWILKSLAFVWIAVSVSKVVAQTADMAGSVQFVVSSGGAAMKSKAGIVGVRADNLETDLVKGSPFCATITTEHTQVFADGNRIHTSEDSSICRDSAGRTRRESDMNLLGAVPQKSVTKLITITDPVAGLRYVLNPDDKIAHKMPISTFSVSTFRGGTGAGQVGYVAKSKITGGNVAYATQSRGSNVMFYNKMGQDSSEAPPITENLGDQDVSGVHATGTRITTTIPSGSMGNEQPILVTSETWYSPELKATVMTKHNEPWAGELRTQFTNVNTAEPDRSLFTIPSDYKIVNESRHQIHEIQGPVSAGPSQE